MTKNNVIGCMFIELHQRFVFNLIYYKCSYVIIGLPNKGYMIIIYNIPIVISLNYLMIAQ